MTKNRRTRENSKSITVNKTIKILHLNVNYLFNDTPQKTSIKNKNADITLLEAAHLTLGTKAK